MARELLLCSPLGEKNVCVSMKLFSIPWPGRPQLLFHYLNLMFHCSFTSNMSVTLKLRRGTWPDPIFCAKKLPLFSPPNRFICFVTRELCGLYSDHFSPLYLSYEIFVEIFWIFLPLVNKLLM